ncbi:basic amino acid ABC transporter substrate-binding protein [Brachyspira pilosicoli]|uniref:Basic amino acid ABC transporter substrate-binding protein n=1 Tax=Brachyspira pilosicoli TaxID=52584 RepID=A0A5C8F7Q8_BRAPL|nr:basic amino acid ABC transporter substrate-binding protein [Brachyspira pilosicoli]TXJ46317.1 basic amino acid ABC transporter substrate-binding protein [Brachyspira pilosicoli]
MKKIFFLFLCFTLLILSCNNNTDNKEVSNEDVLIVGIDADFPPFGYFEGNEIKGFDYDIINEVAKVSGLNIEVTAMKFDGLLPALQTKKIDAIIAGMTVTEERKKFVNFSTTYYVSSQVMLVNEKNDSITNFDNLIGKNVGVVIGTTGDTIMTETEGVNTQKFDTGAGAVLALAENKIDAIVFDKETCKNFAKYNDGIKLIESDAVEEDYAIAVRKEDTLILDKINEGLSVIMTNGTYEKLIDKNFK